MKVSPVLIMVTLSFKNNYDEVFLWDTADKTYH